MATLWLRKVENIFLKIKEVILINNINELNSINLFIKTKI